MWCVRQETKIRIIAVTSTKIKSGQKEKCGELNRLYYFRKVLFQFISGKAFESIMIKINNGRLVLLIPVRGSCTSMISVLFLEGASRWRLESQWQDASHRSLSSGVTWWLWASGDLTWSLKSHASNDSGYELLFRKRHCGWRGMYPHWFPGCQKKVKNRTSPLGTKFQCSVLLRQGLL